MNLNNITFGNPTIEQKKYLEEVSIVDDLFLKFKTEPFPNNDSELVKDELNELVDLTEMLSEPQNASYLSRYKTYDRSLSQAIITAFKQKGIDVENLTIDIINDLKTLLNKLKYFYQRPRPKQIAQYYKLAMFPFNSFSADTPSYPSGHTLEAYVVLNVIANKFPNEFQYCESMIEDVANSRLHLGLHYVTDNEFAIQIGKEILKHKAFTGKYGI
jgi:hypothetical protein